MGLLYLSLHVLRGINMKNFFILFTDHFCVFYMYFGTNNDFFPTQY